MTDNQGICNERSGSPAPFTEISCYQLLLKETGDAEVLAFNVRTDRVEWHRIDANDKLAKSINARRHYELVEDIPEKVYPLIDFKIRGVVEREKPITVETVEELPVFGVEKYAVPLSRTVRTFSTSFDLFTFTVHDGNPLLNDMLYTRWYTSKKEISLSKAYGYTILCGWRFCFPFRCSRKTAYIFYKRFLTLNYIDKVLVMEGEIPEGFRNAIVHVISAHVYACAVNSIPWFEVETKESEEFIMPRDNTIIERVEPVVAGRTMPQWHDRWAADQQFRENSVGILNFREEDGRPNCLYSNRVGFYLKVIRKEWFENIGKQFRPYRNQILWIGMRVRVSMRSFEPIERMRRERLNELIEADYSQKRYCSRELIDRPYSFFSLETVLNFCDNTIKTVDKVVQYTINTSAWRKFEDLNMIVLHKNVRCVQNISFDLGKDFDTTVQLLVIFAHICFSFFYGFQFVIPLHIAAALAYIGVKYEIPRPELWTIIFEELVIEYFGTLQIILIEFPQQFILFGLRAFIPLFMHLFVALFPIYIRYPIHMVYNYYQSKGRDALFGSGASSLIDPNNAMIKFVEENSQQMADTVFLVQCFSYLAKGRYSDLLVACFSRKEMYSVLIHLSTKENLNAVDLMKILGISYIDENQSPPPVVDPEKDTAVVDLQDLDITDEHIVVLSNKEEDSTKNYFFSVISKYLPKWILSSPTFTAMVTLGVLFSTTQYATEGVIYENILKHIPFSDMVFGVDCISTAMSVMTQCYEGVRRVFATGKFSDFFELSKDVRFRVEANKLLYDRQNKQHDEVLKNVARARELIASREHLTNESAEFVRLVTDLRKFVESKEEFVKAVSPRSNVPLVLWLNGPPGTGKTELINSHIETFARAEGIERFVGDVICCNINDKYCVSTNTNQNAWCLVWNDIPSDYTQYAKEDKIGLDVLLQMMIDIFPLAFRSAAVEDKGKVYNNVKLIILTSNHYSYVFGGESDKLLRRLQNQVIVDVYCVDESNRKVPFEVFSKYPQAERNDCWRFRVLRPECPGKHLVFKETDIINDLNNHLQRFSSVRKMQGDATQERKKKFLDNICPCGTPYVMHVTKYQRGDELIFGPVNKDGNHSVQIFSEKCNFENCELSYKAIRPLPLYVCSLEIPNSLLVVILSFILGYIYVRITLFYNKLFEEIIALKMTENVIDRLSSLAKYRTPHWYYKLETLKLKLKFHRCRLRFESNLKYYVLYASVACAALYFLCRNDKTLTPLADPIFKENVKAESMDVGVPKQEQNFPYEKKVEWAKKDSSFNVVTLQTVGVGLRNLVEKIRINLFQTTLFYSKDGNRCTIKAHALVINPDYLMICKHFLNGGDIGEPSFDGDFVEMIFRDQRYPLFKGDMYYNSETEYVIIRHSLPHKWCSLHQFFINEVGFTAVSAIRIDTEREHETIAYRKILYGMECFVWEDNVSSGDCMTVLVGNFSQGAAIFSVLSYGIGRQERDGSMRTAGGTVVSKKNFSKIVAQDKMPMVEGINFIKHFDTVPLSLKSQLRNVSDPKLQVIGTRSDVSPRTFKSSFSKSILHDSFAGKLSKEYAWPSKMAGINPDGEYTSAFYETFSKLNDEDCLEFAEGVSIMEKMADEMFPDEFIKEQRICVKPLDLEQTIFGVSEIGISRINFSSSPGVRLRERGMKDKTGMFTKLEDGDYEFDSISRMEIKSLLEIHGNNQLSVPVVEFVPKDEMRPAEKIKKFKVRLFGVLDAVDNLEMRMLLMPIIQILLRFPERSECYGGMNAGSKEWDDFANFLRKFEHFTDMDFSNFDICHKMKIVSLVAYFLYYISKKFGFSEKEALKVFFCVSSLRVQQCLYLCDLFIKYGGLPSGVIVTLILNSIVNSFLARFAFSKLVKHIDVSNFKSVVSMGTVGDDNASGISKLVIEFFNFVNIAPIYKKLGYTVTPASKIASAITSAILFQDLVFIKRKFVWSDELNSYVAPLDKDSIYKALCFQGKVAVTAMDRLLDVIQGAQREFFLHGRDEFENFQEDLSRAMGNRSYVKFTYEELLVQYKNKNFLIGL